MTNSKENFKVNLGKTIVIEMNHFCNLHCIHCYVPNDEKVNKSYMTYDDAKILFDKIEKCGFNRLLFTGGEPLANPDFKKIYQEAWDRGFVISVFTNATLFDDEYKKLFTTKKPDLIRISLFGGSDDTYEKVTGARMFESVYKNILYLHQHKVEVRVKIPLLRQNIADIKEIHTELRNLGISSKLEVRILPRFNGDTETLKYRFTPKEIVALNIDNENVSIQQYEKMINGPKRNVRDLSYCLYECQPFLISPESNLHLCFFIRDNQVNIKEYSFEDAIKMLIDKTERTSMHTEQVCDNCKNQSMCPYCPGWAKLEVGSYNDSIQFLCDLVTLYDEKYKSLLCTFE